MPRRDALVIGAGVNGLVAALRLAVAGWRVAIVERRPVAGGLAASEELAGGAVAGVLDDTTLFRPSIADALDLGSAGLERVQGGEPVLCLGGDRAIVLDPDSERGLREIAQVSETAGAGWARRARFLAAVGPAVRRLLDAPPPPLAPGVRDLPALARTALGLRGLGRGTLAELLRVLPMAASDWLRESFESPLLVEALAAPGIVGTWLGPHAAGTAGLVLLREAAAGLPVRGGATALVGALEAACRRRGVELLTGTGAAGILLADGGVRGVLASGGDEIEADRVLATCSPRTALLQLLPRGTLPLAVEEGLRTFRSRGTTARLLLAVRGPVTWAARPEERFHRVRIGGGDPNALELAADAVKYHRLPDCPHLEVRIGDHDGDGVSRLSALVSFVPYALDGGWTSAARDTLTDRALDAIERYAPGTRDRLFEARVLAPPDLEERYGLPGGQIHHGEHALDQLFFLRPTPELARYRTPVTGLYLAGSGSHPGGGLSGMPGWLGAGAALADAGR